MISKPRANTVLVRHYEIKQECRMVEIKANGDIWCDDQKRLAANQGTIMEFNCKTYNQKYWKKAKNSNFLPETVHISPTAATKFWVKEKNVVQNALLCCQVYLFLFLISFDKKSFQKKNLNKRIKHLLQVFVHFFLNSLP